MVPAVFFPLRLAPTSRELEEHDAGDVPIWDFNRSGNKRRVKNKVKRVYLYYEVRI